MRPLLRPGRSGLASLLLLGGALAAGCPAPTPTADDDDDSTGPPSSITQVSQIAGSYQTISGQQLLAEGAIDLAVQGSTLEIGEDGSYSETTASIMAVVSADNPRYCSRSGTGTVTVPIPDHFTLSVELTFADEELSAAPNSCLIAGTYAVELSGRISDLVDDGSTLVIESIELEGAEQDPPSADEPMELVIRFRD